VAEKSIGSAIEFCKTFGHTPKRAEGLNIVFCACCLEMMKKQVETTE
jgi:hypothetical protein